MLLQNALAQAGRPEPAGAAAEPSAAPKKATAPPATEGLAGKSVKRAPEAATVAVSATRWRAPVLRVKLKTPMAPAVVSTTKASDQPESLGLAPALRKH